jgi:hypothetical protein
LILLQHSSAAEKSVQLNIPVCTSSLANAVVVGVLEDVPGVRHARINGLDAAAIVFFDNTTTSVAELRKALHKANITVESDSVPLDRQGRRIVK